MLTSCRICGSKKIKFIRELQSLLSAENRRYFRCGDCRTLMDELGVSPEYRGNLLDTISSPHIKHYIQVGCGIASIAVGILLGTKILAACEPTGRRLRFLDVGASMGHSLSLAQMTGCESLGIEPSSLGRIGKELFGLEILENYLEEVDLPENSFDLIHASEVIEHVQNPEGFARSLIKYLKTDGVILLTTPNAEAAASGESVEKEWYELFSPGSHMNLFSPQSIRLLLRRSGIRHVHVLSSGGTSKKKRLWIIATNHSRMNRVFIPDLAQVEKEAQDLTAAWLKRIIKNCENKNDFGLLYEGALYRLFEHCTGQGIYDEALELSQKLDGKLVESYNGAFEKISNAESISFDDYLKHVPAFAGLYFYLKGILDLNHTAKYAEALKSFTLAEHLLKLEKNMAYYRSSRIGWPEESRFKQGLALYYGGNYEAALAIFEELLNLSPGHFLSTKGKDILTFKGLAHYHMRENRRAISAFIRHLGKDLFRSPYSRQSLVYLGRAFLRVIQPSS